MRACAKRLAQDGAAVCFLDLDADQSAETVASIMKVSDRALARACVSLIRTRPVRFSKWTAQYGAINVLLDIAAITDYSLLFENE